MEEKNYKDREHQTGASEKETENLSASDSQLLREAGRI